MSATATTGTRDGPEASRHPAALVPTLVFMASMVSVVSSLGAPLIPTIARSDGVSLSTGEWLLTATLLAGALATPVMGRLADGPRQRQVLLSALAVVLAGCVLAALANNFTVIVIGRALQGIGLGLLPVTMAVARNHLSPLRAGRTIATLSITTAVGAGLGYPLTGVIAEYLDIHAAFWFGAIMAAGALVLGAVVLPGRPDAPSSRLDAAGLVALSLAVTGVSVVLSEGGQWGWTSTRSLSIAAACVVLGALWVRHELRMDDPLVDLRQVANRSVLTADVSGFLICVAMYLFLPVAVEFVQVPQANGYGFGASIVVSGLVLLPLSAGTLAASRSLPAYERRFGTRSMIPLGSVVFALAASFFAFEHRALWEAFVAVGLAGIGVGFTFAAMPGFIVRAVPSKDTGSATGFYQVLRSIGLSVGSALSATVLTAYTDHGHTFPTVGGFRATLILAAALCLATALISYVLPGRRAIGPGPTSDDEVDLP